MFLIVVGADCEIWIAEIQFYVSATPPEAVLRYPQDVYSFLCLYDSIDLAPISPGFEGFVVSPSFPAGISFNRNTGEIEGVVSSPSRAVYQIEARDRITQTISRTNVTIEFVLCSTDWSLIEVVQVSHLNSETEQWRLLSEEDEMLGEGRGIDCGKSVIEISQYFCLPPGKEFAIQRKISEYGPSSRTGRVILRWHLVFRSSLLSWNTFAELPFDSCDSEWSEEGSEFALGECSTFRFASSLLLSRRSEWSLNGDSKVDYYWFYEDFEEDWRWRTVSMESIERVGNYYLRGWFSVDKSELEAVDLLLANTERVWIALNGQYLYDRACNPLSVTTIRISGDRLADGRNLLAIWIYRNQMNESNESNALNESNHTRQLIELNHSNQSNQTNPSNESKGYEAQGVLLRTVTSRAALWVGEELVSVSASSSLPDFYAPQAIDGDPTTLWKGKLENGLVILKLNFQPQLAMGISAYCITASQKELETAPTGWKVRVQTVEQTWMSLQSQNTILFHRRGEKRCFPVTDPSMQDRVVVAVEFVFQGNAWQTELDIAELHIETLAFDRVKRPPFAYPIEAIEYVLGVEFPDVETPQGFYTNFVTSSPLPLGVSLDSGSGRFIGTPAESSSNRPFRVVVQAELSSRRWSTTVILTPTVCSTPFSLVTVSLDHVEDVQSSLSFSLWSSAQLLTETFVSSSSSTFSRAFCVLQGDYRLQFEDASNAGFLSTTYTLQADGVSLAHGFFNPGFSSPSISFHAGLLLPPRSLWYYSLDDQEPLRTGSSPSIRSTRPGTSPSPAPSLSLPAIRSTSRPLSMWDPSI